MVISGGDGTVPVGGVEYESTVRDALVADSGDDI